MAERDTKARMVAGAIALLREQGAAAVTIDAVLATTGAPRGSVYHHFPGGRNELVLTAARAAAGYITRLLDDEADSGDPAAMIERFAGFWERQLEATDFRAGCPVVALAVDARDELPEAAALVRESFAQWHERLSAILLSTGRPAETADALATLTISAIEGAVLLCRARRSGEPLRQVAQQLRPLLAPA